MQKHCMKKDHRNIAKVIVSSDSCVIIRPFCTGVKPPQNREKRVSESNNPYFPPPPKEKTSSQKHPHFPCGTLCRNWDFLTRDALFWDRGNWGLFGCCQRTSARTTPAISTRIFLCQKLANSCPTLGQLLASRILYTLLVGEKQHGISRARFCTQSCSKP